MSERGKRRATILPSTPTESLLACFNDSHTYFAVLGGDNRLKIWDVTTGRLLQSCVDPKHLSSSYTCLAWSRSPRESSEGKKRQRSNASSSQETTSSLGMLALGTEQGTIVVWDLSIPQVLAQFNTSSSSASSSSSSSAASSMGERHTGRINDVLFDSTGQRLFTCGDDGTIRQWDVKTGQLLEKTRAEKTGVPVQRLALSSDDSKLLSAATTIRQWDWTSKKVVKKFAGHSSPVRQLAFVAGSNDEYFLSCAQGDRFVYLWGASPEHDASEALRVFVHESSVAVIDAFVSVRRSAAPPTTPSKSRGRRASGVAAASTTTSTFNVSAVSENGEILGVWLVEKEGLSSSSEPQAPACLVTQAQGPADSRSVKLIRSVFTAQSNSQGSLLVARGSSVKPFFESVAYLESNEPDQQQQPVLRSSIVLAAPSKSVLAAPTTQEATGITDKPLAKGTVVGSISFPAKPSSKTAAKSSSSTASRSDFALAKQLVLKVEKQSAQDKEDKVGRSSLRVDSLHTVLAQALLTNDTVLLDECLQVVHPRLINNTVQRLPPKHVLPFLRIAINKFQSTPANSVCMAVWIRSLLENHTAYLLTVPALSGQITTLYQLIDERVGVFNNLMRVSGRLDMIVSQLTKKERGYTSTATARAPMRGHVSINDDSSEDDLVVEDEDLIDDDDDFIGEGDSTDEDGEESGHFDDEDDVDGSGDDDLDDDSDYDSGADSDD